MEVMGLCTIRASTRLGSKLPGIIHFGISLSLTPTVPNFSGSPTSASMSWPPCSPLRTSLSKMRARAPRKGSLLLKYGLYSVRPALPESTSFQMALEVPRCFQMFLDVFKCVQKFLEVSRCF
eukprot:jgi/Chrzof1/4801/UNPLg00805.t1